MTGRDKDPFYQGDSADETRHEPQRARDNLEALRKLNTTKPDECWPEALG